MGIGSFSSVTRAHSRAWVITATCFVLAQACGTAPVNKSPPRDAAVAGSDAADRAAPIAPSEADARREPAVTAPAPALDAHVADSANPDTVRPPADRDAGPAQSPLVGIGTVQLVRGNFAFVEGARWVPERASYFVSDAYGDTIFQFTPPGQFEPFRASSNGANCLDLDSGGRLVVAECGGMRCSAKGAVSRLGATGTWTDAITDYRGLTISHPNDLVALPDGSIIFSDTGIPRQLLRIDPSGALSYALPGNDNGLNGLALSPRKDVLYVGYNGNRLVRAFDVQPDRLTGMRTVVAMTAPAPDGMCVDAEGNLYVGTTMGVQVFDPRSGNLWGVIALPGLQPGDRASECAFADPDARTLYISAVTKLFRVRLARPGVY